MQLVVRVESGDRASTFRIQVGDGRKSFKWLALVAAQRFGSESPKGKLRQRERKFPCTNPANTNLVPSRCYTSDIDFFHPDALLVEQLRDGDHLTVEVAPRVYVDEAGSPVKSRWQTIAFAVSPSSSSKRDAAIAEEYDAQNAKKVAIKAIEDEAERLENMRKADHIREIIADQLPDPDQVEEALSEDWFNMNKKRVLDALVEDPEEQGRIKDVLKQHYVQLDELFKTFAASGSSIADAQDLELSEFEDFCHQASLVATGPHSTSVMVSCFQECNGDFSHSHRSPDKRSRRGGSTIQTAHVSRPEFLNSLIWFALFMASTDGSPEHGGGAPGSPAWAAEFATIKNKAEKLEIMLEVRIAPLIARKLPGSQGKIALNTDSVLARVYDVEDDLRRLFDSRALSVKNELSVVEFVGIVDGAGLVGDGDGKTLTLRDARQTFAAAQSESAFTPSVETGKTNLKQAHALMSFPEFVEAAVRIGLTKWPDAELSLADRVDRALQALVCCPL
jgi:hypothetical protein